MDEKNYKLGNYEFETLREYRQAQEDLKKIKYITGELDIHDPEVALRLYNLMRSKKIKFKSEVGKSFFWCISDIVAENSKNMMKEKRGVSLEEKIEPPVQTNWRKTIGIACILIAFICFGYYGVTEYRDYQSARKLESIQKRAEVSNMVQFKDTEADFKNKQTETQKKSSEKKPVQPVVVTPPPILEEYTSLHDQNSEMTGWLKIDGTPIDYPVMQSTKDAYDFYLTHAFDKSDDLNGTLFVDARNNIVDRDTNIIVYGHNMKSQKMFGSLKHYLDQSYLNAHPTIQFNTIYEKATYQIVAVCLSKVEYQDDDSFRYYNFLKADNEAAFNDYLANIRQIEVFGKDIDAKYGDKLLTLSTCNNYIEDGRMFIVAKKI
jgi:sortase B